MRISTVAAICLLPICGAFAAAPPAPRTDVPGTAAQGAPAPAAATPAAPDAAARHAKRAACLKDAKAKKLVGAEKTSFLKTCIAAP